MGIILLYLFLSKICWQRRVYDGIQLKLSSHLKHRLASAIQLYRPIAYCCEWFCLKFKQACACLSRVTSSYSLWPTQRRVTTPGVATSGDSLVTYWTQWSNAITLSNLSVFIIVNGECIKHYDDRDSGTRAILQEGYSTLKDFTILKF